MAERSRFMAFHMTCTRWRGETRWMAIYFNSFLSTPALLFLSMPIARESYVRGSEESKINFRLSRTTLLPVCENAKSKEISPLLLLKFSYIF